MLNENLMNKQNKKSFFTTLFVPNSIFRPLEAMLKRMVNVPNDFAPISIGYDLACAGCLFLRLAIIENVQELS